MQPRYTRKKSLFATQNPSPPWTVPIPRTTSPAILTRRPTPRLHCLFSCEPTLDKFVNTSPSSMAVTDTRHVYYCIPNLCLLCLTSARPSSHCTGTHCSNTCRHEDRCHSPSTGCRYCQGASTQFLSRVLQGAFAPGLELSQTFPVPVCVWTLPVIVLD